MIIVLSISYILAHTLYWDHLTLGGGGFDNGGGDYKYHFGFKRDVGLSGPVITAKAGG